MDFYQQCQQIRRFLPIRIWFKTCSSLQRPHVTKFGHSHTYVQCHSNELKHMVLWLRNTSNFNTLYSLATYKWSVLRRLWAMLIFSRHTVNQIAVTEAHFYHKMEDIVRCRKITKMNTTNKYMKGWSFLREYRRLYVFFYIFLYKVRPVELNLTLVRSYLYCFVTEEVKTLLIFKIYFNS